MATNQFTDLFSEQVNSWPLLDTSINYPPLSEDTLVHFGRGIEKEEIKEAIHWMGALKSLGPNGFGPIFFQSQQEHVGDYVTNYVQHLFQNPHEIKEVNSTFIVLVTRKDTPETLCDLHPISLWNVIFKTIMKVITNQMKSFLPDIIAPNQCSFVPSRHNTDNIVVA